MYMLLILCSLVYSAASYTFFSDYRPANCGETVTNSSGLELPAGESCEIRVEVPEGMTMTISLIEDKPAYNSCKKITIVDESSYSKSSLCLTLNFSGAAGSYTIKLKNLIRPVKAQIILSQSSFGCGQIVKRERALTPFEFRNEGGEPSCALVVASTDSLLIQKSNEFGNECTTQVEVAQGPHLSRMVKSTGNLCLGDIPLTVDVHCGMAVIYFDAPPGASLKISTIPSKNTYSPLRRLLECDP